VQPEGQLSDNDVSDWWTTEIIDMAPGQIRFCGHAIEDLIGSVTFPRMIWFLTRGELPTDAQAKLLKHDALSPPLIMSPEAPSIAAARMAAPESKR